MYQGKVLLVLVIHLIFAIFLKIVFGTDTQRRIKDLLKHLTWSAMI